MKKTAVFGIFSTRMQAEICVDTLKKNGFMQDDISVLMSSPDSTRELATEKNTKAPEGATTGATAGGVIGGTLGLLAGIGSLAIPGVGPLIAQGQLWQRLQVWVLAPLLAD